ncbi:MAG: hypothetical protein K2X39_03060 [Silvanigrellaceae bacterium]|nr:hypothetical protein [Silvanigrellaceae bacterium]
MFKKNKLIYFLSLIALCCRPCHADVIDLGVTLVSEYTGSKKPKNATRRLSPNGERVFNPGVFVGRDFRPRVLNSGISLQLNGGFFQDYQNATAYFAGVGTRYSYVIRGNFILSGVVSATLFNQKNYDGSREYSFSFVPAVEFSQVTRYAIFDVDAIKFVLSYISKPSNDTSSLAPSDFVMLSVVYSISI